VTIAFDAPLNSQMLGQVTLSGSSGSVPVSRTLTNGNQTLTVVPAAGLRPNTLYTLTIAGVSDLSRHAMSAPVTTMFTTGAGADVTPPAVTVVDPANGTTGVPPNTLIWVRFNKQVAVTTANLKVYPTSTGLAVVVAGSVGLSADGRTATFSPAGLLQAGTPYGVFLTEGMTVYFLSSLPLATGPTYDVNFNYQGLMDVIGNLLRCGPACNFSFTTGVAPSSTGPQVTGVSPAGGSTAVPINGRVMVQFNEPVDSQTLGQVTLSGTSGPVSVIRSLTNGNQTLLLVAAVTLRPSTPYTVQIAGVTDLSGFNPMIPVTVNFMTGSTADFSLPQVSNVGPASGATEVPANTPIQIRFNKAMNLLTIGNSSFNVSINGGEPNRGNDCVGARWTQLDVCS
jgi:Big-like domain-containing protein